MTAAGESAGASDWLRAAEAELKALDPESRPAMLAEQVVASAREVAIKALRGYLAAQGEDAGAVADLAQLIVRCSRLDPEFAQLSYGVDVLDQCVADDPSRPCLNPTDDDASEAVEMAAGVYRFVRDRI
jgi:HEPN domain-containing protein